MMNRLFDLFIHTRLKDELETHRRARLFSALLFLSLFFSFIGLLDSSSQLQIITYELYYLVLGSISGLLVLRLNGSLDFLGNLYAFVSWSAFSVIIYHSGGIESPAFEWLLVSIIPAYIFCGKKGGNFWWMVNLKVGLDQQWKNL